MTYELPENIDNNKIFIINRSDIEGRLDPSSYRKSFKFISNEYRNVKLSQIAYINPSVSLLKLQKDSEISFIPMEVIDAKMGRISEYKVKTVLNSKGFTKFQDNDLLWAKITPCMQNGKSAIVHNLINGYGCGSTEFFVIRPKNNEILIEYIHFLLRHDKVLQTAQNYYGGSAGQQRVPVEFLNNFSVPLLPLGLQREIVSKMTIAYNSKSQKDNEAKSLLQSIDTYLLNELGIILPKKDNSLKNRIFITNLNKVSGGRYDPKLYDNNTTALKNAILELDSNIAKVIQLSDYIVESVAGDWGIEFDDESEDYTKCLVVRATEFDNIYNLNLNNSRVKYRYIKTEKLEKIDIKTDDLLIEKSGGSPDQPVGRISIITQDMVDNHQLCYSNFIHKIRVDSTVLDPQYMFCYLKVMHNIKLTESMQSQTNGIRNLIMKEYLQQPIIVPITEFGDIDINKQIEIADHIANIRLKAKQLQQEAKDTLEKAKLEVEKMILGE